MPLRKIWKMLSVILVKEATVLLRGTPPLANFVPFDLFVMLGHDWSKSKAQQQHVIPQNRAGYGFP